MVGLEDPGFAARIHSLTTMASMGARKVAGRDAQQRSWTSHSQARRGVAVSSSHQSKAFVAKDAVKRKSRSSRTKTMDHIADQRIGEVRVARGKRGKKRPRPTPRSSDSLQRLQAMRGQLLSSVARMRGLRVGLEANRKVASRRPTQSTSPAALVPELAARSSADSTPTMPTTASTPEVDSPSRVSRFRNREKTAFPPPSFGFDMLGTPKRTLDLRMWKLDGASSHGLARACTNTACAVVFPPTGVREVECYVRLC